MGVEVQPCALPSILRKVVRKAPLSIPDIQQLSRRQMSEVAHDLLNPWVVRNPDPAVMRDLSFPDRLDPSSLFPHLLDSLNCTLCEPFGLNHPEPEFSKFRPTHY